MKWIDGLVKKITSVKQKANLKIFLENQKVKGKGMKI